MTVVATAERVPYSFRSNSTDENYKSARQRANERWGMGTSAEEQKTKSDQNEQSAFFVDDDPMPRIPAFEIYSLYEKFFKDVSIFGETEALRRFDALLLLNMRTYVQEERKRKNMNQIATEFVPTNWQNPMCCPGHFRNAVYEDILRDEPAAIRQKVDARLHSLFFKENELFYQVWDRLLKQLPIESTETGLRAAGFTKKTHFPVGLSLRGLCPTLGQSPFTEAWIAPQKLLFVMPSSPFHLEGKTTIAHHAKLIFIPGKYPTERGRYFILDEGYFTGYKDEQIKQFLTVDAEEKPLPNYKDEFFRTWAVLNEELGNTQPHLLFELLKKKLNLGDWDELPIGENVIVDTEPNYAELLAFARMVFVQELQWCLRQPGRLHFLPIIFEQVAMLMQHELLRPKDKGVFARLSVEYKKLMKNIHSAADAQKKAREFGLGAAAINGDFFTQVTSVIDCASGMRVGVGGASLEALSAFNISEVRSLIHFYKERDFETWEELAAFCKKAKIDVKWFKKNTERKKCPGAHCKGEKTRNYMGPCVCPICHAQDEVDNQEKIESNISHKPEEAEKKETPSKSISFSDFVASIASRSVLAA